MKLPTKAQKISRKYILTEKRTRPCKLQNMVNVLGMRCVKCGWGMFNINVSGYGCHKTETDFNDEANNCNYNCDYDEDYDEVIPNEFNKFFVNVGIT